MACVSLQTPLGAQDVETLSDPGEGRYPLLLDGTLSGEGDLKEDLSPHSGLFRFPTLMDPWNAFKADMRERTGITFGGSLGVLYQNFSDIPSFNPKAERDTVGQKFTLNFSRDMWKAGTPEALTFDLVVEDRGPIGTENPPLQAGLAAGSIVPTAATWGDFNLGITQAYIRQNLMGNKVQYTIGKIFAPNFVNAYAGRKLRAALKGKGDWTNETVKRPDTAKGFEVLPRRRVVERTFAWLGRCRRLAKDRATSLETSTAWTFIASIKIMTRRLATYCHVQ